MPVAATLGLLSMLSEREYAGQGIIGIPQPFSHPGMTWLLPCPLGIQGAGSLYFDSFQR